MKMGIFIRGKRSTSKIRIVIKSFYSKVETIWVLVIFVYFLITVNFLYFFNNSFKISLFSFFYNINFTQKIISKTNILKIFKKIISDPKICIIKVNPENLLKK